MPVQEFCDRCGKDVTAKHSGAIFGVDDADRDGNGTTNDFADILCPACYRAVWAFIRQKAKEVRTMKKGGKKSGGKKPGGKKGGMGY